MKIKPYVEKLMNSKEYKEFGTKYKEAFLVAGFFVIDFENGANIHQIDYYMPKQKKVAAFTLDNKVAVQILNTMSDKRPEELELPVNIDLDALHGILEDEMKNRSMTAEIKKMIAVIQNINGKRVWNVNCVLTGMDILKAHVDDSTQTVLKMEKSSIMDYVKRMPGLPQKQQPAKKEDIEAQIKQLDKLKEQLKKEKSQIEKSAAIKKEKNSK